MIGQGNVMTIREAIFYLQRVMDKSPLRQANEPVFILRGQDKLAVPTVFFWAQLAEKHNVHMDKVTNAWAHAEAMAGWTPRKVPD